MIAWTFSLVLRLVGWLCYHEDPEYQRFRKSGGNPYYSFLPNGINNDSWAPKPKSDFVSPKDWLWQCNAATKHRKGLVGMRQQVTNPLQ